MRPCTQCGGPIAPTKYRNAKYCSRQCGSKAYHESRKIRGHQRNIHNRTCKQCGAEFTGRRESKFCGHACATTFTNLVRYPPPTRTRLTKVQRRRKRAQAKLDKAANGTRGFVWANGPCVICGTWFTTYCITTRTCSQPCRIAHKLNRKRDCKFNYDSRKRGQFVARVSRRKVFESDGYRCHLCGKLTDRTKKVPHPKAPTVDHLVPLAVGGTHEPTNCRTAHYICNSMKRELGGGEQHVLFA